MRFSVAWIHLDRAVEISQRFQRPIEVDKNRAQVIEGSDVAGVDLQGLAKILGGRFQLPDRGEGAPEIAVGFGEVRLERHRALEIRDGFCKFADGHEREPPLVERFGNIALEGDRRGKA